MNRFLKFVIGVAVLWALLPTAKAQVSSAAIIQFLQQIPQQNPPFGTVYMYLDSTTGLITCKNNVGANVCGGGTQQFPGVPTGSCLAPQTAVDLANGAFYYCNNGTWSPIAAAAGATAFSAVTTGTNTVALHMGAGGTLDTAGGGSIAATSAPWSGLTGFPAGCTNQVLTALSASPTCTTVTSAYVDSSIALKGPVTALVVGTNSSGQMIAAALPSTDVWVGNNSNVPQARAISGDSTMNAGGTMTNVGLNGTLLSGIATGPLKITTGTGVPSAAAATDIIGLFTGCSGTQYLGADGNCHPAVGTGTVTSSGPPTAGQFPLWTTATNLSGTTLPAGDVIVGTSSTPIVQTKILADVRDSTSPAPSAGGDFCAGISSLFAAGATQVDARNPGAWVSGGNLYCNSNPFAGVPGNANGTILKLPCDTITISVAWETSSVGATQTEVCAPNFAGTAANQQGTVLQKCSVAAGCGPNNYPSFDTVALNEFPDGDPNAPNLVQRTSGTTWGTHFNAAGSATSTGFTVTWPTANTTANIAAASGTPFSSADVGGVITDCAVGGTCTFTGRIKTFTDSSHIVLFEKYTGTNQASGAYSIFRANVWPSYVEGTKTSWNQQLFGSYLGPIHFDDSGIANGLGYFSPGICQENCRLDSPGYVPNGGMAGGENNATYGAWQWDKTFRTVSGGAHWSLLGTPNISAGTTAMTVGAASEMYSTLLSAAGGGPLQFYTGTIQGGASNNIAVDVSIDGSVDFGDLNCKHFEGLQIDGVQVGVAHGVSGLNVTGCTLAQTGSMSGAAVHFKTPSLTGSNVGNQVTNISSLSSAALITDDSNTSTNVSGTTYNGWNQLGSTTQLANVISFGTINFRSAAHTGTVQTGLIAAIPATCTPGDLYFATDQTHGQSLNECYSGNTWVQQLNSGASGANQALSNLSGVAINASLVPAIGSDNALDLGSASARWRNLYLGTSALWTNGSGSADTGICRGAAGQIDISNGGACAATGNLFAAGFASGSATIPATGEISLPSSAAPSAPASGTLVWFDSTDLRIHEIGNAATVGTTSVAKTCSAHQWMDVLSTAGVFTCAQPAFSDLTATISPPLTLTTNTLACPTCATTTSGGALSATSPVTISSAGLIAISGITGEQGNGALLQLSTGTVNLNRITKFDTNSNTINSNLIEASSLVSNAANTATTYSGALDASANAAQASTTFRGGDETGAGGASSTGGNVLVRGGNNAATNASSSAGGLFLVPGASTGATQGLQGLIGIAEVYIKDATSTQWDLACIDGTTAMAVKNCGASPTNWLGVIEAVNSNTDVVLKPPSQSPINASGAVTVGDTVCAGGSAGQVTDSGGTATCTNSQGATVGVVVASTGTIKLGDGTSVTLNNSGPFLALIDMNTATLLPTGGAGASSLDAVTGSASQTSRSEVGAGDNYTFNGVETASLTSYITIQDTNSSNNNTSIGLIANCAGTSTGCIALVGNSVSGTGDLFRLYSGATDTNGTLSGGTKEFAVSATGVITSNATSNQIITGTGSNLTQLTFPAPTGTAVLTFPISSELMVGANSDTTVTHVAHSTAVAGVVNMTAITTSDLPGIPLSLISAATASSSTPVASANNEVAWGWTLTGSTPGLLISEPSGSPSSGTGPLLEVQTIANSTSAGFEATGTAPASVATTGTTPTVAALFQGITGGASSGAGFSSGTGSSGATFNGGTGGAQSGGALAGSPFTLTQVGVAGGNATYTGTITGGAANAYQNMWFQMGGFAANSNNVLCQATASTATTIVCAATTQVNVTAAGTATNKLQAFGGAGVTASTGTLGSGNSASGSTIGPAFLGQYSGSGYSSASDVFNKHNETYINPVILLQNPFVATNSTTGYITPFQATWNAWQGSTPGSWPSSMALNCFNGAFSGSAWTASTAANAIPSCNFDIASIANVSTSNSGKGANFEFGWGNLQTFTNTAGAVTFEISAGIGTIYANPTLDFMGGGGGAGSSADDIAFDLGATFNTNSIIPKQELACWSTDGATQQTLNSVVWTTDMWCEHQPVNTSGGNIAQGLMVKYDTGHAGGFVEALHTDYGKTGVLLGSILTSGGTTCANAAACSIGKRGEIAGDLTTSNACAIGNNVVISSTTDGQVQCEAIGTSTGDIIGRAISSTAGTGVVSVDMNCCVPGDISTLAPGGTVLANTGTTSAAPTWSTAPVLGIPGTSTGTIALASSTASGKYTITAPANAATPTLTLPTTSNVLAGQFAGDGTVLSSSLATASAAGTVTAALASAAAGTVLMNNSTSSAAPTYVSPGCQSGCNFVISSENTSLPASTGAAFTANHPNIMRFWNPTVKTLGTSAYIDVTTLHASSHIDVGVYEKTGSACSGGVNCLLLRWHTGSLSGAGAGQVGATGLTAFTMLAGQNYYLASCSDDTTVIIADIFAGQQMVVQGGAGSTANTFGIDSAAGDVCTTGVLPANAVTTNITNATSAVNIPFVMVQN